MESKPSPNKQVEPHAISLILTFCAVSLVFIFMVYAGNFVFGSELGEWTYRYFTDFQSIPLWIPVAILVLLGVIIFIGSRQLRKHEKWVVIGCLIVAIIIQILFQQTYYYRMADLIQNDVSNSFYSVAIKYSPYELLSQFQSLVATFPLHARTNLPGKILLFQFLTLFTSSPQAMGYLLIFISSLGGLLLYGIVKRLFNDKLCALYAFIFYALIPCKQFFIPILNTVTPVFILLSLYLFVLYLEKKNITFLFLLGLSLYALILFEPSPLVVGVLFIGVFLYYVGQKIVTKKDAVKILLLPTVAFLAIYLLFVLAFSFDLWKSFQYMLKDAVSFNADANRNYWIWLRENVKSFFFDAGLPVMMIFIYFNIDLFTQWEIYKKKIFQWPVEHFYTLFLILTFGIVLLLGVNRGETTRLWIYLAVFFQVPAAVFLAKNVKSSLLFFVVAATLVIQILVTLQQVAFIAI